jgi:hypothetical protein
VLSALDWQKIMIYQFTFNNEEYQTIYFAEGINYRSVAVSLGKPVSHTWTPLPVYSGNSGRSYSDLCSFTSSYPMVVNDYARNILSQHIDSHVEFLPLVWMDGPETLYIVNVISTIDCLDTDKSTMHYFSDEGVMYIEDYVFHNEILDRHRDLHIFKIPQVWTSILVSQQFKDLVTESELTGANFIPVSNPT